MKQFIPILLICTSLVSRSGYCQNPPPALVPPQGMPAPPRFPHQQPGAGGMDQAAWQKFDLDFPGGSPLELVAAIEKARGKRLNALVSKEDETVEIPAMKFKDITVPELFTALLMASQREVNAGGYRYQSSYTFETQGHGEEAIWYFRANRPPRPQEFCRFYQLGEDLRNYSVEDITTAIQTGWKMLGVKSPPQLKFHPETKLLIAVGPNEELATIDAVLKELRTAPQPVRAKTNGTPARQ